MLKKDYVCIDYLIGYGRDDKTNRVTQEAACVIVTR